MYFQSPMSKPSAFSGLTHIIFSTFGYALILGGFGAIVSDLLDWDLALSVGSSDIAIPKDMYGGILIIIAGVIVSLLTAFWDQVKSFVKAHKGTFLISFILIISVIIFGGSQLITYLDGGEAIIAARENDVKKLEELFASQEYSPEEKSSMLMWAIQKQATEAVTFLLDHGTNPMSQRDDGLSAMKAACAWGTEEIKQALKSHGNSETCE